MSVTVEVIARKRGEIAMPVQARAAWLTAAHGSRPGTSVSVRCAVQKRCATSRKGHIAADGRVPADLARLIQRIPAGVGHACRYSRRTL
jgi:hypothetical protein